MYLMCMSKDTCSTGLRTIIRSQANISISNSSFIRDRQWGAYIYWIQPYYIIYTWPLIRDQKLSITHSTFADAASGHGLNLYVYNSDATVHRKVTISSNLFKRNLAGLYFEYYTGQDVTSEVLRNTFVDNDGKYCNGAMYVYNGLYYPHYNQQADIIAGNQDQNSNDLLLGNYNNNNRILCWVSLSFCTNSWG